MVIFHAILDKKLWTYLKWARMSLGVCVAKITQKFNSRSNVRNARKSGGHRKTTPQIDKTNKNCCKKTAVIKKE